MSMALQRRPTISNEEQLWLMHQVKMNSMTIDEAVSWTEARESELRSTDDDVTVNTPTHQSKTKSSTIIRRRTSEFKTGHVFKSILGRRSKKSEVKTTEKRSISSSDETMDGLTSFAHDLKNKQIYNFSVYRFAKHKTPQKRILQIDFDAKQISIIQHGSVIRVQAFSSLANVDGQEGKKVFIYFDDSQEIELNAENLADKTKLIRLLNVINEQNEYEERGQPYDPCDKLQLSFKVIKEGHLEKKGAYTASNWNKRLVVIRSGELAYYRVDEEEQSAALNIIHLSPGSIAINPEDSNTFTIATTKESYRFRLPEGSAILPSMQEKIRDEWIQAIQDGCSRHFQDSASSVTECSERSDDTGGRSKDSGNMDSFDVISKELEKLKKTKSNDISGSNSEQIDQILKILKTLRTSYPSSGSSLAPNETKTSKRTSTTDLFKEESHHSEPRRRSIPASSFSNPFSSLSNVENIELTITNIDDIIAEPSTKEKQRRNTGPPPMKPKRAPSTKLRGSISDSTTSPTSPPSVEELLSMEEDNPYELASDVSLSKTDVTSVYLSPPLTNGELRPPSGLSSPISSGRSSVKSNDSKTGSTSTLIDSNSDAESFPLPPPPDDIPLPPPPPDSLPGINELALPPPPPLNSLLFPPPPKNASPPSPVANGKILTSQPPISPKNTSIPPPPPPVGLVPPPPPTIGIPPPPPPPIGSAAPKANGNVVSTLKDTVAMRPFHWAPVPKQLINKSMWKNADDLSEKVNLAMLHDMFQVTSDKKKFSIEDQSMPNRVLVLPTSATPKKKQAETFLDRKTAQNLGIFLAGFKIRGKELTRRLMIVKEEDGGVPTENIIELKKFCPEPELKSIYAKHVGREEAFSKEDKFMVELCQIPRLGLRLETLSIIRELPQEIESLQPEVEMALNAWKELFESKLLETLLAYILAVTNRINASNSKGVTKGIRLSSLEKTTVMRTNDRKFTLLQVVLKIVKEEKPEILKLDQELKSFSKAQAYSIKGLMAEIDVMRKSSFKAKKNCELFRRKKNQPTKEDLVFCSNVESVLSSIDSRIVSMADKCLEIRKTLGKVLIKFGESLDTDSQELFGWIRDFLENFKKSLPR
ncbi:uncharacterized protein LOC143451862 [Clavelina lepadiformis]|uniref:uncharacterized protein LOC143451862 n=1 Tax=Clavelina lepadiformis TaxID=159417 RepID=UPI00404104B0